MTNNDIDKVTVTFPDLSPADAVMMAHELERELTAAGVPADAIRTARADDEAMDLGTVLVIFGGIGFELLKEAAKGAANEAGHQIVKQLAALPRKTIHTLCQRRHISAEVTMPGGRIIAFGDEHAGNMVKIAAPADIGTLGVIILGASRFPHLDGLDNPAFARSAATAKALFGRATPVFKRTAVLDLFDDAKAPADIIKAIARHIGAISDMRDLLIYYCGHGGFLRDRTYYLTLTGTDKEQLASTGLKLRELRHDLETKLLDRRLYVVLDCCYAGEAVKEFMGPSVEGAVEIGLTDALPANGWTVLTAAASDQEAMAPIGHELTMFTGALAHVLSTGATGADRPLSFADIAYEADRYIRRIHGLKAVRPQCHSPRQDAGDLARWPLFMNVAARPQNGGVRTLIQPTPPAVIAPKGPPAPARSGNLIGEENAALYPYSKSGSDAGPDVSTLRVNEKWAEYADLAGVVVRRLVAVAVAFSGVMVGWSALNSPPAHPAGALMVPMGMLALAGYLWKGWR